MKWITCFGVFCTTLFSSIQAEEFPIQEVMEMAEKDLEARKNWVLTRDIGEIRATEIENTARLKEILARHGLPSGYEGEDLDVAIIQLVLHSSDLDFQKAILEKIPSAGDLWSDMIDILTDRVLLRQGLPQRFGTHMYHESGLLVPYPIEDLEAIDDLREEIDEPDFADYLEVMRGIDQAIAQNKDGDLYKIIFNMMNDFDQKPSDYLYYASFEPNRQPEEDGGFLAFEDPALAAAFALCKTTPVRGDAFYKQATEELGEHLLFIVAPQTVDDARIFTESPLYMYIVPRGIFMPHEPYSVTFLNRLLISPVKADPILEIKCGSVLETLIIGGGKIKICGADMEYEYKDTYIRDKIHCMLFFDTTLENEGF